MIHISDFTNVTRRSTMNFTRMKKKWATQNTALYVAQKMIQRIEDLDTYQTNIPDKHVLCPMLLIKSV